MNLLSIKRLIAFALDYLVIVAWGALLFLASQLLPIAEFVSRSAAPSLAGHAIGFVTMTLPVLIYFSLLEGLSGRTIGKAIAGIEVQGRTHPRAGLARGFMRNIVKFLPWEIAHTAIWQIPGQPFVDPVPPLNLAFMVGSCVAAILLAASVFLPNGRAIHDRIAGTRVSRHKTPNLMTQS